jgi:hypothetical protein
MAKKITIDLEAKTDKAIAGIDKLGKEVKDLNKQVLEGNQDTKKGLEGIEESSRSTAKGIKGIGTAIKAAGIGLLLGALGKLKEVFEQNQKVADLFATSFEFISIVFNDFVNFIVNNTGAVTNFFKAIFENPKKSLTDFADAFKRNIQERFESYLDTLGYLASAVKKVFSGDFAGALEDVKSAGKESIDVLTGVNDSFDKGTEIVNKAVKATTDYVTETTNAADANVKLEKSARLAEAANQGLIEKYDRQAEQLRQIRDDESKSFAERIKANEELGILLDEQEKAMTSNAQARVAQAAAELAKNKDNVDLQIAYQEALNEQAGIEAQITGFRSEQQTNTNSLLREQKDLQNELALIGKSEREIERLELQQDYDAKKALIEREVTDETERQQILLELKKQYNSEVNALNEESAKNEIKWAELTSEEKLKVGMDALNQASQAFGEESAVGKAAAIANATIQTYESANASYKSLAPIPFVGPALGAAAAGAAIVSGIANVKKITSTKIPSSKSAGGSAPSAASTPSVSQPPQFNIVGAGGTNQLAEAIGSQEKQPVKAYVVSNDVTTAQSMDRNIVEGASI